MAVREWTKAQEAGIKTVDKSLLVSAAAGSGKTTVLAERCAYLVCDAKEKCGVDELLVVTFTEAAAAEMKDRIHRALAARNERSADDHTARQLAIIDRASVGTLHGFCSRLLHQHFHLLGLDPEFVILDNDETGLLKLEVARELFADRYDLDDEGTFGRFIDSYGDGRDDNLVLAVIRAHNTLCSVLDPAAWKTRARQRITQAIAEPLNQSELGVRYGESVSRRLESLKAECAAAGKAIKKGGRFPEYVEYLRELYGILNHWTKVLKTHGVDGLIGETAGLELPKLGRVSSKVEGKESALKRVSAIRKAMNSGAWRKSLRFTSEEWKEGLKRILPHVDTFLSLVDEFSQRYSKAKEEEGGLDFSDLERLALRLLRDPEAKNLSPSAVARWYHQQYRHVLVDEYQDINEVQDAILTLISRETLADRGASKPNFFCVGDVKQSIYRFRLAEPARFLARRKEYSEPGGHGKVIDLQQNFRSRAPLLDAINGIFERVMRADAVDLDYDESQKLKAGLDFPAGDGSTFSGAPIELHLLPKEIEGTADEDRSDREAALLAHRILEIIRTKKVIERSDGKITSRTARFGDIVILLRAMQYKADQFSQALRNAGIPVHSESATGYFEATEINDVLSLLKVLDNQRQDIPLAAFLRGPLANLPDAEDCLARIHLAYGTAEPPIAFHEAVVRYANERNDELAARLRDIRRQLEDWRKLARQRPLAQVLWTIYDQTGYLAFCGGLRGGEQRQANLIELHERAHQFGTFRRQGLSRFLEFLEKLKTDSDIGQASIASDADDVVRIMSVHRSKGLEFPIVLLPDLGKAINLRDAQGSIVLDRSVGLGLDVVDDERRVRYPSLASSVVKQRLKQQALAEEMRVLYVAMTRAKEHLILCGTCREEAAEHWRQLWAGHAGPLPGETILDARSMLDWIGPVAAAGASIEIHPHSSEEISEWMTEQTNPPRVPQALAELKPLTPAPHLSDTAREVIDRVCTPYPFEEIANGPAAQSVTAMAKDGVWTPSIFTAPEDQVELDRVLPKPRFLTEEIPADAAERGTATHAVLEHLDFANAGDVSSITKQIEAMVASRRITTPQAASVDLEAIRWLMAEPVGQMLREHGKSIYRELPVYFSADSKDPLDETMVRGRLDVLVDRGSGLVIVDYKTDRVTGAAIDQRAEFYRKQLRMYGDAMERITGKKVEESILVFLHPRECRRV